MRNFLEQQFKLSASVITIFFSITASFVVLTLIIGLIGYISENSSKADEPNTYVFGQKDSSNKLLSIRIDGTIEGESSSNLFGIDTSGSTYGYDVKKELYDAADSDDIKGVILDVDSPGGTIYGARAIADGVAYYRDKTHKPIYAHISGLGASGAYWASVSTDKILADYGSETGSIGVIYGPIEYYDKVLSEGSSSGDSVSTQNGITYTYYTAGGSKDLGSPYRPVTADEAAFLQKSVDTEYDDFVSFVSKRRDIPEDTIRNQIKALAYGTKDAKDLKLIDEAGSREDAYNELASKAGLKSDDYQVVRKDDGANLLGSIVSSVTHQQTAKVSAPSFCSTGSPVPLSYYGDISAVCAAH